MGLAFRLAEHSRAGLWPSAPDPRNPARLAAIPRGTYNRGIFDA